MKRGAEQEEKESAIDSDEYKDMVYDIEYGKHATPTQNEVYAKSLYEHITKLK